MVPNQLTMFLNIVAMIFLGHSWYIHYRVKDGIARIMLLWGCILIFLFLVSRTLNLSLLEFKIITSEQSRSWASYAVFFIYFIIAGQWYIQQHHAERNEDDKLQFDKKELTKRRKESK